MDARGDFPCFFCGSLDALRTRGFTDFRGTGLRLILSGPAWGRREGMVARSRAGDACGRNWHPTVYRSSDTVSAEIADLPCILASDSIEKDGPDSKVPILLLSFGGSGGAFLSTAGPFFCFVKLLFHKTLRDVRYYTTSDYKVQFLQCGELGSACSK